MVRRAKEFGVSASDISCDWNAVIDRKNEIVRGIEGGKEYALRNRKIEFFHEKVVFKSPTELTVGDRAVRGEKVILSTGSKTLVLPVPGIEKAITSNEALDLRTLPESLVIIGGGFIAMEFAHIFNAVDVKVTILEAMERILTDEDDDISAALTEVSERKGITVHAGSKVLRVEGEPGAHTVAAETADGEKGFPCEMVMLAAGRVSNIEGFGAEEIGIERDRRGVKVNEYLQTTVPNIYAAGDVVNRFQLTPVASYEGRVAATNALTDAKQVPDYRFVTRSVFTDPPVASVGLTESQAREQGFDVEISRYSFAESGSAIIAGETEGFVKTVLDAKNDTILGVHILGAEAPELIHEAALAMKAGFTPRDLAETIMIHPSLSEAFFASVTSRVAGHTEGCCG
ncbi:MAG: NAD(P)/FAD-dependent oxidoreductase [Armatimonadetes bacterium]|nr:NAD(P)/FAD-dependent oxidoreductase [Armatimonadota bacterium]